MANSGECINIYLVSDASGETVVAVSQAALAQFLSIKTKEYMWPLIRSKQQIDEIILEIMASPGLVIYTMLSNELSEYMGQKCREINVPCVSAISQVVEAISNFAGVMAATDGLPGKHKTLDCNYYKKIEAINFTIQHDDGHYPEDYNEADILLLGVSRTSKSPTSLYLAQRGYKTANLPIIYGIPIDLSNVKNPLIVGLNISPEVLIQIRISRLLAIEAPEVMYDSVLPRHNNYVDYNLVRQEIAHARKLFSQYGIKVIDVSKKAVEETAAEIINLFFLKKGEHRVFL